MKAYLGSFASGSITEDAMSPIQGVSAAVQAATKAQTAKTESATQEAQETVAITQAEARKGDQQAIRKLARLQASEPQQAEPVATPPAGTGKNINVTA